MVGPTSAPPGGVDGDGPPIRCAERGAYLGRYGTVDEHGAGIDIGSSGSSSQSGPALKSGHAVLIAFANVFVDVILN